MTAGEDELRSALRLLEQRAPETLPDVARRPARRRIPLAAVVASAAAVVLVVAGMGLFLGLRTHGRTSVAGPDRSFVQQPAKPPASVAAAAARLRVLVTLSGGPIGRNGKQPPEYRPQPDVTVSLISLPSGRGAYQSRLRITSTTNRRGVATFSVNPGRYAYRFADCNKDNQKVTLRAGESSSRRIDCVVP